ncbi:MAG: hypothetical protein ACYTEQ_13250 [Planctomycetota bacterium]|jgi:hypothetical protein
MEVAVLFFVLAAVLLAIASGIWVAVALVRAISLDKPSHDAQCPETKEGGD